MRNRPASHNFGLAKLSLCLSLAWAAAPALAQNAAPAPTAASSQAQALKSVVVTATRSSSAVDSIAATVTSINRTQLKRRLPSDDSDLFKDEPDVAFAKDLRRHGASRVNIRGLEDNRVVSMVDGVRLGDYYDGSGPTSYLVSRSPTVMPDFLKQIEIVRGATSSLYGSDAIGGVVGYLTLDPADLLVDSASSGFRLRGAYTGANSGFSQSALGAWRAGDVDLLLGYSHANSKENSNFGHDSSVSPQRSQPNAINSKDRGLLAKMVWQAAPDHKISLTFEGRDHTTDANIYRLIATMPKLTKLRTQDGSQRQRFSLEWQHSATTVLYDRLSARLYQQQSKTRNHDFQNYTDTSATCSAGMPPGMPTPPSPPPMNGNNCYIENDFNFDQNSIGTNLQLEKALKFGSTDHLLSYGLDFNRTRVEELRDYQRWNQTTGLFSKSSAQLSYPLRDFAIGKTDTIGLFVQDEINGLASGRLSLTPSLRFDRVKLTPENDALAQQLLKAVGSQAVAQSNSAWSPKLGLVWRFNEAVSAYGQLASGFRAPNYNDVNRAFFNFNQGYGITPNPKLKPETSLGVELGLRLNSGQLRSQLSVFDNHYRNFIDLTQLVCSGSTKNPNCIPSARNGTFQSVNLTRVRIYGAEARTSWNFAPGWSVGGALAWAHGTNQETGRPLNSIEPVRLSANLARDFGAWGVEARLRAANHKNQVDDSSSGYSGGKWFQPGGYSVTDIAAWWNVNRQTHLTLAVNNVFNKKYWLWSDIRQADSRNPVAIDFYSQPKRSINLAVQVDF